jgi:hypothetical protein
VEGFLVGLFNFHNKRRRFPPPRGSEEEGLALLHIDQGKRYDVYCSVAGEERVYEDVRFVALRQFETVQPHSSAIGSYLEIEFASGARAMIPSYGIQLMCERGVEPVYRVLRQWGNW